MGEGLVPTSINPPPARSLARCLLCLPAQTLLRWAIARGCSVVPKSSSRARIEENARSLRLAPREGGRAGEVEALRALDAIEPQQRRMTGETLVGARRLYASVEEVWR